MGLQNKPLWALVCTGSLASFASESIKASDRAGVLCDLAASGHCSLRDTIGLNPGCLSFTVIPKIQTRGFGTRGRVITATPLRALSVSGKAYADEAFCELAEVREAFSKMDRAEVRMFRRRPPQSRLGLWRLREIKDGDQAEGSSPAV